MVDIREYLRVVRRRWVLISCCALATLALSAAYTFAVTPQYASSARLFISTSQSDTAEAYQGGLFSAQRVTSYADLTKSRELASTVIDGLSLDLSAEELTEKVSAEVVPETVILEITAIDSNPGQAQALSQAYAEGLADMVRELETPAGKTAPPIKATIVDPASQPTTPVSPDHLRSLLLGLTLGVILGFGLAVLRELLDTSIKSADDLTEVTSAPLLGAISYDSSTRSRPLVTTLESHAPRVEAFRVLRTNLQFVDVDSAEKVFVVTSAVPEEGKTTTAVNLAITLAQAGQRTLLIEGDLRRPRAALALDMDQAIGVTTVLLGRVSISDAIQKHSASDLHVLGSGAVPPNPAELLQSQAMADLLAELRTLYDIVIIDAPPLLPVTDAALIAAQSDGTMMVVRHGKTTKDQLRHAAERLTQVDAKLIGVLLNMVPDGGGRSGYGYGYGYGYSPTPIESKGSAPGSRRATSPRRA